MKTPNKFTEYAKHLEADDKVVGWTQTVLDKYLKTNNPTTSEVEHIIDFLVSDKAPKRLGRVSYTQAKEKTEAWVLQLNKEAGDLKETKKDTQVVLDFKDGFKVVRLVGKTAYEREGKLMRHCVSSYFGKDDEIYSLRDKFNKSHCTMSKSSQQIKGKGNGDIHPKYIDYVIKFLEWSGLTARESEMKHLGYKKVMFPKYCLNKMFNGEYVPSGEEVRYSDDVVVFDDIGEAVSYQGEKTCLFGGYADFRNSKITSLGKLTSIGGSADFEDSQITSLGKLTSIGWNVDFRNSKITSLGKLTSIGGSADFEDSQITSLGKLTSIGWNADFRNSKITSLGKLTSIGGSADFEDSNVTSEEIDKFNKRQAKQLQRKNSK
jgi:hypothetical protein